MYIKVWSKVNEWDFDAFEYFKLDINANVVDYNTTGNQIHFIIYEVEQPFSKELANDYGLDYEVLTDYKPQVEPNQTFMNNETLSNNTQSDEDDKSSVLYWWQKD